MGNDVTERKDNCVTSSMWGKPKRSWALRHSGGDGKNTVGEFKDTLGKTASTRPAKST